MKKKIIYAAGILLPVFSVICSLSFSLFSAQEALEASAGEEKELPVIMYHALTPDPAYRNLYFIPPSCLEEDLEFIKANGYTTVTVSDLTAYTEKRGDLPDKPIMLIFDDGYYNNLKYALPLLQRYDMEAVIAPVGKTADEYSMTDDRNERYAYLSWDDLRRMQLSGHFEIQDHTYDLHHIKDGIQGVMKYPWESDEDHRKRLEDDLTHFQERAASVLLKVPEAFIYPYGAYDEKSEEIIRALGFRATFTCTEGFNVITRDRECLFLMKRFLRSEGRSVSDIINGR